MEHLRVVGGCWPHRSTWLELYTATPARDKLRDKGPRTSRPLLRALYMAVSMSMGPENRPNLLEASSKGLMKRPPKNRPQYVRTLTKRTHEKGPQNRPESSPKGLIKRPPNFWNPPYRPSKPGDIPKSYPLKMPVQSGKLTWNTKRGHSQTVIFKRTT